TTGIPGFFKTNARAFLGAHVPLGSDAAGYYSTAPLRKTLDELVDFERVNQSKPRLMVGAAHVRTSMMRYFDSRNTAIKVEHIMIWSRPSTLPLQYCLIGRPLRRFPLKTRRRRC